MSEALRVAPIPAPRAWLPPTVGPRHDIDAHETRLRVGYRAEHAAQQLLAPRIEQAAADAVLAGHHDRRYPLLQTFCCDLALLFRCPTAAALATRDHLDAPITNACTIGRRSVLRIQRHCHHTVVLPQGRQVAQFSSRRAMCCRDIAYSSTTCLPNCGRASCDATAPSSS